MISFHDLEYVNEYVNNSEQTTRSKAPREALRVAYEGAPRVALRNAP